MHELFLAGAVPDAEHILALEILQGYCAMTPIYQIRRNLIFRRPTGAPKAGFSRIHITSQPLAKQQAWRELAESLGRQSFVVMASYDVQPSDFSSQTNGAVLNASNGAKSGQSTKLNDNLGTLHWWDFPDPPQGRPVNVRRMVEIRNEKNLVSFLETNNHQFALEQVQETYRVVNDNVVFYLSRLMDYPAPEQGHKGIREDLPAFEDMVPCDPANQWLLEVKVEVMDGTQPALMQMGIDELMKVKKDLTETMFELRMVDRHKMDTRIP